ncbi:hypothetical protein PYW08_001356 [Mythimna loreyi]|uniref:Uncharacterized protein n=1 Tax=Mythimna loreyi TaxID=667449 RepID=A0ACC2R156_9NEOP|nr:hypothetical protein PYW08_001356 [Mythimna loreyi]
MTAAGRFPLFRLGTLLARQLSKPVAEKIKRFAMDHPWFRRAVCVRTGRVFYTLQLRLRIWTLALRQPLELPPLSEQAALHSGADILGEVTVFALGGLIVVFEVNRQAEKQELKLLDEESRRVALLLSLEELRRELALQQRDIDRLQAALRHLAPQHYRSAPRIDTSPVPPTTASPTPPMSEHSTPPMSDSSSPPTPDNSSPPKPDSSSPPTPDSSSPPTPDSSSPLTPDSSSPPTPDSSSPPTPDSSSPPTPDSSSPPTPDSSIPPITECPPPPITECPPPPISDCPPSAT